MPDFRPHTSQVCFYTAPCCFNLSYPAGLTGKGITTDLGYTCPKGCVSVNVCVPVGVCLPRGLAILTRISSVFFFHQFSDGSPNMSEIKSGTSGALCGCLAAKAPSDLVGLRLLNFHSTRDNTPAHAHTHTPKLPLKLLP